MTYDFLILSSLPINSGCYLRAKYLADSLENNGAKVKLITPCKSKPFMLDFLINFAKYIFCVIFIEYKIGIAMKPYPNTTVPLLVKKLIKKNKIIVDIDDIDFGYRDGLISSFSRAIQKPFPKYFDVVTFHNELLIDFILKEYEVDRKTLYNLKQGVDYKVFDFNIDIKGFKKDFIIKNNLTSASKILIYSAHLNIASDLDIILVNIKKILDEKDVFLIIAGGGPSLNEYIKLAQDLNIKKIFFTGYLTPAEIAKYVLISDFTMVYYKDKEVNYYRSSMKIRENLALKKKIICNNVGELKLFEKFTYQSEKNVESFIELLEKLIDDSPADTREMDGYEFVKKEFDWQFIGGNFLKYLGEK